MEIYFSSMTLVMLLRGFSNNFLFFSFFFQVNTSEIIFKKSFFWRKRTFLLGNKFKMYHIHIYRRYLIIQSRLSPYIRLLCFFFVIYFFLNFTMKSYDWLSSFSVEMAEMLIYFFTFFSVIPFFFFDIIKHNNREFFWLIRNKSYVMNIWGWFFLLRLTFWIKQILISINNISYLKIDI